MLHKKKYKYSTKSTFRTRNDRFNALKSIDKADDEDNLDDEDTNIDNIDNNYDDDTYDIDCTTRDEGAQSSMSIYSDTPSVITNVMIDNVNEIITDGIGSIGKIIGAKDGGLATVGKKRDPRSSPKDGPKDNIYRLHKDAQSVFQNIDIKLPELLHEKKCSEKKLAELKTKYESVRIADFALQENIYEIENNIAKLDNMISNIVNKTEEKKYLLKTGPIITKFKRLNDIENNIMKHTSCLEFKQNTIMVSDSNVKPITKQRTALEQLREYKRNNNGKGSIKLPGIIGNYIDVETGEFKMGVQFSDSTDASASASASSAHGLAAPDMEDIVKIRNLIKLRNSENINKKRLYDKYMAVINKDYISRDSQYKERSLADICNACNGDMVINQSTGMLHCNKCGQCEKILIDSDKQSHKEPPKEQTTFSYRRINHLNEVLSQIQAKESTNIPERVYDKFRAELKKRRMTDLSKLTNEKGHSILKTIGEADYYEHVPYIISQLNGKVPPTISPEVEEIIRSLFMHVQHPFSKHCPEERNNFVTYNFTLYKLCQLLELDELLPNLKESLKDRTKQYYQDCIWKKICADLKWQFIPTE